MPEQQNIEYKSSWHDDYLKWIAGFANASGGKIFIGVDDNGVVTGIADYKKLLDEIPNKVRDLMGMTIDVNLHDQNGLYYLEILVQPYPVSISLRGRYYFRSGSTKQELTGTALTEFLLRKSGMTWDEVTEPSASFADIDETSVRRFLATALKAGRIGDVEGMKIEDLFANLRLCDRNGKLKRAAIVLFGKDPSNFFNNCVVKIGRFGTDSSDLKFQEIAEGNLIELLHKIPDILNQKFFIKPIEFEGLQRIEKGEYPVAAIREMLLNALVHRNYLGTKVFVRQIDNSFSIWNDGILPDGITLNSLYGQHTSKPRNPLIADVAFKGGYIDAWGRGTLKIIHSCKEAGLPEPEITEQDGGILVTLNKTPALQTIQLPPSLNDRQKNALTFWNNEKEITTAQYAEKFSISVRAARRDLAELVSLGLLVRIGDNKASRYVFPGKD